MKIDRRDQRSTGKQPVVMLQASRYWKLRFIQGHVDLTQQVAAVQVVQGHLLGAQHCFTLVRQMPNQLQHPVGWVLGILAEPGWPEIPKQRSTQEISRHVVLGTVAYGGDAPVANSISR